jgi:ATP-dependent protease ClpP protease subunit
MIINAKQQGKTVVLTNLVNEGSTFELYDSIVSEKYYEDMPGVECKDVTNFLNEASGDITLRINSKGGDVGPSLAIFNRLRAYDRGDVTTIVDGYAWSCAGWIAMAGKKRIINTGCLFMMHNPILSATITNAADIDKVRTKWNRPRSPSLTSSPTPPACPRTTSRTGWRLRLSTQQPKPWSKDSLLSLAAPRRPRCWSRIRSITNCPKTCGRITSLQRIGYFRKNS